MPFDPVAPNNAWGYLAAHVSELLALTPTQQQTACADLVAAYSGTPVEAALTTSFRLRYDGTFFRMCAADSEEIYGEVADPWLLLTAYEWPT
jgi:hypothetical protein